MKKIFSIFGALLAGAMMFSCNTDTMDEGIKFGTEITASVEALAEFASENAEAQTLDVTANGEWMVVAPAWLEVTPTMGGEGTTTITVKARDNKEKVEKEDGQIVEEMGPQRSAVIQFAGEQDYEKVPVDKDGDGEQDVNEETGELEWQYLDAICEVKVSQDGDPNKWDPAVPRPVTIKYFNEVATEGDGFIYELTGKITEVANTLYGNFYFDDGTDVGYVYGLVTPEGEEKVQWAAAGLKVNDVITVRGSRGYYHSNTTTNGAQMSKAVYVSHEAGEESPIVDATVAEFLAAEKGGTQYRISGVVTSIARAEYGNIYLKDATGEVYVYGIGAKGEFETMGIEVGDIVTLISNRGEYEGTPQAANSTLEKKIDVTPIASVTDFLALAEGNDYYMLTGTVGALKEGDIYGNFDLSDGTNSVYVYGLLAGYKGASKQFQTTLETTGLKAGDTLTLIGKRSSYNDVAQVGGAFYFSHEAAEGGEEGGETPEPEIATSTFGAITEEGTYKVENATVVAVTTKGYLLYDTTGYAYVYVGSKTDYAVGTQMTVTGAVTYYFGMMQIAPSAVENVTTVEVTHPEAEVMDGAAIDAYMSTPTYKYVKATGKLSVGSYTNLIVEGTTNTVSVSYFDGDLSSLNEKDVTLYGYLGGSNTNSSYATMYLVSYEEVAAEGGDDTTEGGRLYWGNEAFTDIYENALAGSSDEVNAGNITTSMTPIEGKLTVSADGFTYDGLTYSLGSGGKFKFGPNQSVSDPEGDKETRLQIGGTGKIESNTNIVSFEVPAAGTLKIDVVNSSKSEERTIAVAIDGAEVGRYTPVLQGTETTGEIFTVDCSTATAGSKICIYTIKSGVNLFSVEYTY